MDNIIFISVVRDFDMYNKVIRNNPFVINDKIILKPIDNKIENLGLSKRYNDFLDAYDYSKPGWFVFCHEDWEILENISEKLKNISEDSLYGSFGARLISDNGTLTREYIGDIYDCPKDNDENLQRLGFKYENLTIVDTLDCQVLIVHSVLINKFNLRFDENLEWDLYVEDFCLNAFTKYKIESKVLNLEICHHSRISDISERPTVIERYPYINEKYKNYTFAGIIFNIGSNTENIKNIDLKIRIIDGRDRSMMYKRQITSENDARFIAMNYISSNAKILDVGCACGDFAVALKGKKECEIWGMEYNQGSIDIARKTRMFEDIFQIDLNNFDADSFRKFVGFFDYIVFGDVLEHINYPQKTLEYFKDFLKPDGAFLLSIPNIAHASIKSNLLVDDFTYTPCGLLDETHVRFFTHKSIPEFLADINLEIKENKFTYQDKYGLQPNNPYDELPPIAKKIIFENFHSYVCQYVMKVKKSDLVKEEITKINKDKLYINEKNAPKGIIELRSSDLKSVDEEPDNMAELKKEIQDKDHELNFVKSSKFWKLRRSYMKLKGSKN
jgi:2-polyprenyl-3-methyl-5-hydroxy-6-metoxy-1,4-benzoquinol methylase